MSSFNCEYCGTAIIDSPSGYITSCEHHRAESLVEPKDTLTNWNYQEKKVMDAMGSLHKSQVDIVSDFRIVINELASNSLDVNNKGNVNG